MSSCYKIQCLWMTGNKFSFWSSLNLIFPRHCKFNNLKISSVLLNVPPVNRMQAASSKCPAAVPLINGCDSNRGLWPLLLKSLTTRCVPIIVADVMLAWAPHVKQNLKKRGQRWRISSLEYINVIFVVSCRDSQRLVDNFFLPTGYLLYHLYVL